MARPVVMLLPGAGNNPPKPSLLRVGPDDLTYFEVIRYPGWQRYVEHGFSAETLVSDLAQEIVRRAGNGPIRILGISLGGHLGYAVAAFLERRGHPIQGVCAVDSFIARSDSAAPGWVKRAFAWGAELLRKRRAKEFFHYVRGLFWRAVLRLAGAELAPLCRFLAARPRAARFISSRRILEHELSMRLLIKHLTPWFESRDVLPISLTAPAILLRSRNSALHDDAWRKRCPNIQIHEIAGNHSTMFEAEHIYSLREAFLTATADWRQPDMNQIPSNERAPMDERRSSN